MVRQSIYNALERWPELREIVEEERELHLDEAETALFKAVKRRGGVGDLLYAQNAGKGTRLYAAARGTRSRESLASAEEADQLEALTGGGTNRVARTAQEGDAS